MVLDLDVWLQRKPLGGTEAVRNLKLLEKNFSYPRDRFGQKGFSENQPLKDSSMTSLQRTLYNAFIFKSAVNSQQCLNHE